MTKWVLVFFFSCFLLSGQSLLFGQTATDLHLSFVVNEDLLIGQILNDTKGCLTLDYNGFDNRISYQMKIKNLKNAAWKISEDWYNCWSGKWQPVLNILAWSNLRNGSRGASDFLDKVRKTPEFQEILNETNLRKEFCRKQWETNLSKSYRIIQELTGLNPTGTYTIYIGYPGLAGGTNFGENEIHWGGHEEWPNYTTVYLWHEILHSYITGSRATEFLNHALVQLITDNELREKLNNLSQAYPPFEGHSYLIPLETKILPYWNDYLKNPKKGILEFRRMLIEEKKLDLEDKTEKKK